MSKSSFISQNFKALKGWAAIVVMLGHYLPFKELWVLVSVALLIFSISSGYFSFLKYKEKFSILVFWKRKFYRLFLPSFLPYFFFSFYFISYFWPTRTIFSRYNNSFIMYDWFFKLA